MAGVVTEVVAPLVRSRGPGGVGAVGLVAAAGLVLLAQFGATFKRTVPEWDAEAVTFLILGLILGAASVWAAWRPSRASLSAFVTVVLGVLLAGAIL